MRCDEFEQLINERLDEGKSIEYAALPPDAGGHLADCPHCVRLHAGYRALAHGLKGLAHRPQADPAAAPFVTTGLPSMALYEAHSWSQPAMGLVVMTMLLAIVGWLVHSASPPPQQAPASPHAAQVEVAQPAAAATPPLVGQAAVTRFLTREGPEIAADLVQPVLPLGKATQEGLGAFFSAVRRAVETGRHEMPQMEEAPREPVENNS